MTPQKIKFKEEKRKEALLRLLKEGMESKTVVMGRRTEMTIPIHKKGKLRNCTGMTVIIPEKWKKRMIIFEKLFVEFL